MKNCEVNRYRYELRGDGVVYVGQIFVPVDLELRNVVNVSELTSGTKTLKGYGRIFIRKGGALESGGEAYSVDADEIISDEGVLRTWNQDSPARAGFEGKPSGDLYVRVRKVSGKLLIKTAGQKGGLGVKGPRGLKGEAGDVGPSNYSVIPAFRWCAYAGDPVWGGGHYNESPYEQWLEQHPFRGGKGKQGKVGYPGGPGSKGGPAGKAILEVQELDPSTLSVSAAGGSGGNGGPGGEGGPGGDGGPGGPLRNDHGRCRPSPVGPEGDAGPVGPDGPLGHQGEPGSISINGELQQKEVYP